MAPTTSNCRSRSLPARLMPPRRWRPPVERSFGVKPSQAAKCRPEVNRPGSIVSLGVGLGVTITAEGVETEAELSCLRAEGCHEGQGFLFSRARPNAEVISLLKAQRVATALVA